MSTLDFWRSAYRSGGRPAYRGDGRGPAPSAGARERIMLAAAVADLREALFHQQCVIEALLQLLGEQGVLDDAEVRDRAEAVYGDAAPARPVTSS